jgi:hypothetical protein
LAHFPGVPASGATDGALQTVVGCVTLATQHGFYSPVDRTPCVYFRIRIQEEWKEEYFVTIEGRRERRIRNVWKQVCDEERFCDFYLQDGTNKVYVNGSNRSACRVQSMTDSWGHSGRFWSNQNIPPGVMDFISANLPAWDWRTPGQWRTGRFKFQEMKFEVNEKVAGFGRIAAGVDPMTNQSVAILQGASSTDIDEKFMVEHEFTDWDKKSWKEMTTPPAVLLSDNRTFTENIPVKPAMNLPTYMTQYVAPPASYNMYGAPQQGVVVEQQVAQVPTGQMQRGGDRGW